MEEIIMTLKIGTIVRVISDNENYTKFNKKLLEVTHIAHNTKEHPGYDNSVYPKALCDFVEYKSRKKVPCSLYEYEFEIIN
jgi:hypothetical protein